MPPVQIIPASDYYRYSASRFDRFQSENLKFKKNNLAHADFQHIALCAVAKAFLETFLAQGPQDASAVYAAAAVKGVSGRTLDRAKADLGIESRKKGSEGWEWALPHGQSKDAIGNQGKSGNVGTLQSARIGKC